MGRRVRAVIAAVAGGASTVLLFGTARREGARARARRLRPGDVWRLPPGLRARLAAALREADLALAPEAAVEVGAAAAVAASAVGFALAPPLAFLAGPGVAAAGPVGLFLARHRRTRRTEAALPAALERVAAELRGGGTVASAVDALATGAGPLAGDLARVRARASLGVGLEGGLRAWLRETDLPGVRAAAGALAVAATAGGRAADAVEGLAASQRDRLAVLGEARSLGTQARLSALVVGAAPLGYLLLSGVLDRRALLVLTTTPIGQVCLVVGLALEAAAGLWMRRIVRVEP